MASSACSWGRSRSSIFSSEHHVHAGHEIEVVPWPSPANLIRRENASAGLVRRAATGDRAGERPGQPDWRFSLQVTYQYGPVDGFIQTPTAANPIQPATSGRSSARSASATRQCTTPRSPRRNDDVLSRRPMDPNVRQRHAGLRSGQSRSNISRRFAHQRKR